MTNFMKYIIAAFLGFALIACESEPDQQPPPPDQQQAPQDPMGGEMQQQPPTDVDVSEEELQQFVEAASEAQEAQMGLQMEMVEAVEDEGLSVEVYNQIAQAVQMGQDRDEIDVTAEELDQYDLANEKIDEIEQRLEAQISDAVEDAGMSMERFQELNMAIQQDPALQQQVQQMMMGQQDMQQPPQDPQQQQPPQPDPQ